jgi:hypothetical protein
MDIAMSGHSPPDLIYPGGQWRTADPAQAGFAAGHHAAERRSVPHYGEWMARFVIPRVMAKLRVTERRPGLLRHLHSFATSTRTLTIFNNRVI